MKTTTKPDKLLQLSPIQDTAIDLLLAGKNDRETADTVGVHRTTVCNWRLHHPAFIATLNARRAALRAATTARLTALAGLALTTLEAALTIDPTPELAMQVLRLTNVANLQPDPADADIDAEAILARQIAAGIEQARQAGMEHMGEWGRRQSEMMDRRQYDSLRAAVLKELLARTEADHPPEKR